MRYPPYLKKCPLWLASFLLPLAAAAETYTWLPTAAGTGYVWNSTSNWDSAATGYPNAVGDVANLNNNIAGNQTISLSAPTTVGTLILGDALSAFGSFSLNAAASGSLVLQATGTNSAFLTRTSTGVTDLINMNVQLASPLEVGMPASGNANGIRITGEVSGTNGIHLTATAVPTGTSSQMLDLTNQNNSYTGETLISNGAVVFRGSVLSGQNSALGNSTAPIKLGSPATQTHATNGAQYSTVIQLRLQASDDTTDYVIDRPIDFSGNNGAAANLNGRARFALDGDGTGGLNTNTVTIAGNVTLPSAGRTSEFYPSRRGQTLYFTGDIVSGTGSAGGIIWAPGSPGAQALDGRPNGTIRLSDRARPYTNVNSLTYGTMIIEGSVPSSGPSPIGTQTVSMGDGSGGNIFSANTDRANRRVYLATPGSTFARSLSPATGTSTDLSSASALIKGRYGLNGLIRIMNGYEFGGVNTSGTVTFSGNINPATIAVPLTGSAAGQNGDEPGTNVIKVVHNIALTAATGGKTVFSGVISGNEVPETGPIEPGDSDTYNNTRITINQFLNHPNLDAGSDGIPDDNANLPSEPAVEGTLILAGANTYAGGTEVLGGTLLVNNTTGSGTGSGPVTVTAGRLGGTGTITTTAGVNLASATTLSAGDPDANNGLGVLTLVAPVSWNATGGSLLDFQISRNASDINADSLANNLNEDGSLKWDAIAENENDLYAKDEAVNNDTVAITGTLTVNSSGATIVRISSHAGVEEPNYAAGMVWDLMDWTSLNNAKYNSYVFDIDSDLKAALTAKNLALDVSRFWDTGMVGVGLASVVNPPRLTTLALSSGVVGQGYSQMLTATNGTLPYAFTVTEGSLPEGLTLTADGILTGTPAAAGTAAFTITLTDAVEAIATRSYSLIVVAEVPVVNVGTPLPQSVYGSAYAATLTGTGGVGIYTWEVTDGSLPPGITLSSDGSLQGIPTNIGTFDFEVQLRDASGFTATAGLQIISVAPALVISSGPALPKGVLKVAYNTALSATGGIPPYTWEVAGGSLPEGLILNPNGVISGLPTATVETTSQFTVKVTDSVTASLTKDLTATIYPTYQLPEVAPVTFDTFTVGELFSYSVTATNYPKTFKITGLPKGLKYSSATGLITGRPTVAGTYTVQITASNKAGTSAPVGDTLEVKAINPGMIGSFQGLVSRDALTNADLGGTVTLTTTSLGKYTLRVITKAGTKSATGYLAPEAPHIATTVNNASLTLTLNGDTNLFAGHLGESVVDGWRQTWSKTAPASTRIGYYSVGMDLTTPGDQGVVTLPQGSGYATFNIAATGTIKVVGKTADGQSVTSAGFIGPNGEISLHTLLYKKLGSITGKLSLDTAEEGGLPDNSVSGTVSWSKPVDKTRNYPAGFGPLNLAVRGKYLAPKAGGVLPGLPAEGTASLLFTDGGLALATIDPDVTFTYTNKNTIVMPLAGGQDNPASAKLTLNKSTGAVKGTFKLTDPIGLPKPLVRTVTFVGQVVRTADGTQKAAGYFLLPQLPLEGQKTTQTPILSGGMTIRQPQPVE